jgi:hypothetical protein
MRRSILKKSKTKYRIIPTKNVRGDRFFFIESKKNWYSGWNVEDKTFRNNIKEIEACLILLENGESLRHIFFPSARVEMLKLK